MNTIIHGYALQWHDTPVIDGTREIFVRGAFVHCLELANSGRHDIRLLVSHDYDIELACTSDGTLSVREDEVGLAFDAELPDTRHGRIVVDAIDAGVLRGVSVGFQPVTKHTILNATGHHAVLLWEISLSENPTYRSSSVSVFNRRHRPPEKSNTMLRSFPIESANEAMTRLARQNRPRRTHDEFGNPIVGAERRERELEADLRRMDDDGPGTTLYIPANDPGAEQRMLRHIETIKNRRARNGGFERMSCATNLSIA